ncbi:replication-relaxation family protein [Nocardiopsis tropica]|uniref:Replication-relaxation family protein n=1 Tax=Nocardiopsis tropica TaxID=109330 RepID=A0ABU7KMW2_9ACTN|nr:replication-relaxation family protein [Nocardiopsis umidischolae]MEE2050635.1 replication-relaxation family protein [Nocardiopsis umidischolae]
MSIAPMQLSGVARTTLSVLYQHRLATTYQLRRLVSPNSPNRQYIWSVLNELRRYGLADRVIPRAREHHRWYLTAAGAEAAEEAVPGGARHFRMSAQRAAGPLQQHMLAVVDMGLAFIAGAAQQGDDFGPLDWMPEVAHRYRGGDMRFEDTHLISDALLHYTRVTTKGSRLQVQALVEVDRATMPVPRLAGKLGAYARYYDYAPLPTGQRSAAKRAAQPAWRTRYPEWPRVLVVLDGGQRQLQERRRIDLAVYTSNMMHLAHPRPGFHIGAATMHDLKEHGPHEPIWLNLLRPDEGYTSFPRRDP